MWSVLTTRCQIIPQSAHPNGDIAVDMLGTDASAPSPPPQAPCSCCCPAKYVRPCGHSRQKLLANLAAYHWASCQQHDYLHSIYLIIEGWFLCEISSTGLALHAWDVSIQIWCARGKEGGGRRRKVTTMVCCTPFTPVSTLFEASNKKTLCRPTFPCTGSACY